MFFKADSCLRWDSPLIQSNLLLSRPACLSADFKYRALALFASFGFLLSDNPFRQWRHQLVQKVLILGDSFVRHLANDLRRECVDWAVATFNVSWLHVWRCGVRERSVQKWRDFDLHQVAT